MVLYPTAVCDVRGGIEGGEDLRLTPPEKDTVYCDQDHYGHVSGSGAEARAKGGQSVAGAGRTGFGGEVDIGSGGGTERGGEGQDKNGDGLNQW